MVITQFYCRVITSSLANGPLVLRHELGHSIIDVGEEYDGGFAYYGPNSASDLDSPLPWSHWLSSPPEEPPKIERSVMPFQTYPVCSIFLPNRLVLTFISGLC